MDSEKKVLDQRARKRRKKRVKKTIITIVVIILIFAAISIYGYYMENGHWPWRERQIAMQAQVSTRTLTLEESNYTSTIDVSGYVAAFDTQTVQIRATGAVTGVYVKEGDRVTKGQILATIDDSDQQYTIANLEKQLQSARLSGTTSARDLEMMEMQLENARKKLDNMRAYADFDGVVVSVSIREDDYYTAGQPALTIIDDSKLKATVEIDEIDVQMITVGLPVSITSDSSPGATIEGRISYIPMIGRYSNQGIGVMDVELVIDDPPASLKPGFSFEGTITIDNEQKIIIVPQAAVTISRGVSTVRRLNSDGSTETVTVQVRYLGENSYQILDGVKAGDRITYNVSTGYSIQSLMGGFDGSF